MLSKSQFIRGRQCYKSLWLYKHRSDLRHQPKESQQALLDNGTDVGTMARNLFPGGVLVPSAELDHAQQVAKTSRAIGDGATTIYEAAFIHNDLFVKVDILHKAQEGWELYEVKASTTCKKIHVEDLAVQFNTVFGAGLPVTRACLVHIDKTYLRQGPIDVQRLFTIHDITEAIRECQPSITAEIARQQDIITGTEPSVDIGPHCSDPYLCDFRSHCWAHIPSPSVFDLRDIGRPDSFALYRAGIVNLEDIPPSKLGWRQKLQINGTLHRQNHVNVKALRRFLDKLWHPLCFLDFETTYMTPVPLFNGTRPYEQIPFQFSLHIQDEPDGETRHMEFLAQGPDDPQESFIRILVDALPRNGCILTYNQRFEIGILSKLAARIPFWKTHVDAILPNIRDMMKPFKKKHVYFGTMNGSYSIKKVLPALVPELSYKNLEISDGAMASSAYLKMRSCPDAEDAETIAIQLKKYCHLDTWAMVLILEKLQELLREETGAGE